MTDHITVFYKPYESQGQAWPITFVRLIWGVVIFLVFMTGIFLLKQSYILATLVLPLLAGTIVWSWYIHKTLKPLSKFVSLSSVVCNARLCGHWFPWLILKQRTV